MSSKPHDTGYKELFSHPEFVRELMLGFVPAQISYPAHQRERFAKLMNRWVKFFLFKSALDIDSENIDFMEESPMSLRKYVLRQREEGREQGRLEGMREAIINLHRNMKLAAEQIAAVLQLPVEKVERILAGKMQ